MWEELSFLLAVSRRNHLCLFPRACWGKNRANASKDWREPLADFVFIAVNKDLTPSSLFLFRSTISCLAVVKIWRDRNEDGKGKGKPTKRRKRRIRWWRLRSWPKKRENSRVWFYWEIPSQISDMHRVQKNIRTIFLSLNFLKLSPTSQTEKILL